MSLCDLNEVLHPVGELGASPVGYGRRADTARADDSMNAVGRCVHDGLVGCFIWVKSHDGSVRRGVAVIEKLVSMSQSIGAGAFSRVPRSDVGEALFPESSLKEAFPGSNVSNSKSWVDMLGDEICKKVESA